MVFFLFQVSKTVNSSMKTMQFSSKWNKCKFMCPLCNMDSEKRHIRSHTMSAHSTSLDIIEAEYSDCETRTE